MGVNNPSDYSDLISIDIDTIDLDSLTVTDADVVNMVDPFIFDGNDHKSTVEDRLSKIEKRLAILEPKQELLDKYEVLQSLYEQYKAAEAMLMGPDPEDEE